MSELSHVKQTRTGALRFGTGCQPSPIHPDNGRTVAVGGMGNEQLLLQELTREWVNRLGFAPHDFWLLRWWRLFLSTFVTSGGITFWFALVMVAFTSGIAEWKTGTLQTALTFWGVHLVTLVLEGLIFSLPMRQLGFEQAHTLFFSRNVGPSAGFVGCLGLITTFLPKPWRFVVFSAILVYLLIALFLPSRAEYPPAIELSDDLAHLIAYPLACISAYLFETKNKA